MLQSLDFTKRFLVQVDASDVGLGAVLVQGEPGEEKPVLFLSKKLFDWEKIILYGRKRGAGYKVGCRFI